MSLHSGAPEKPRIINEDDRPGPPPLMSEERGKGRGLTTVAAVLAVAAFAGIVWYAYDQGRRIGSETAAPLIQAETSPTKVRPDSPGGMQVPHQDKLVLDDLGSGRGAQNGENRVERLLPPPETPLPAPEPLSEPAAASGSAPAPAAETPEPATAPNDASEATTAAIPPARVPDQNAPQALVPPQPPQPASSEPAPAPTEVAEAPAAPAPKPEPTAPAAQPSPPPPPAAPAAGNYNIQVAALRSEEAAEREWARVQSGNRDLLGALTPRFQRISTDNGVFFRVQGGPLTQDAARAVCDALTAKGQACLVVQR